jgi:hypothetical protein
MSTRIRKAAALAMLCLAACVAAAPARAADKACDRACLEGLVGKYLQALAAHDPARLQAGRGFRFIENDQPLKPGQGTWASVSGLGSYRHDFADPQTSAAGCICTVRENDVPALLDIRLKLDGEAISEIETFVIRDALAGARYEQELGAPEPLWLQPVAPADRIAREALIATVDKYFTGMQRNDPKGDYSFFDPDCNRLEHATQTTNLKTPQAYGHSNDTDFSSMGCEAQFKTGFLGFVTEIRDRRYLVVDEERQAVFAFADFDHNGTVRVLHLSTGKDFRVPAYFDTPRTLQVAEAFRMRRDKIHRIEMTLTELPYGMRPAGAPAPVTTKTPPADPKACARDCLSDLLVQVLQAIADHRPAEAPLAADVRYTENGQALKPGDGLWGTATAIAMPGDGLASLGRSISAYKLFFADPATGQAGCLCATNENGTPGVMALRIRAAAGKVSEIEAVVVREETTGPRGGTVSLFRTPPLAEFSAKGFAEPDAGLKSTWLQPRKSMIAAVNRYFDTVQYDLRAPAPASIEGSTRLNGNALPGPVPASDVRGRRILVTDEESGLALASAMLDHDGGTPAGIASTNMLAAVFKIEGGRILRVEALERPVIYGMTSGWTE